MRDKGMPKRDGSGRSRRLNRGREGCDETEPSGRGMESPPPRRGRGMRRGRFRD